MNKSAIHVYITNKILKVGHDPKNGEWEKEIHVLKAIQSALTRLEKLEPLISELVEARKSASPGEWKLNGDWTDNDKFIATAANISSKLGEM